MANSKQIVYLSQAQYAELIANGSITVDGVIVTYDENDIYVTPQAEPVTDVRINGTSIAANGVANIPIASTSTLGLVKINPTGQGNTGIVTDANGYLNIQGPTDNNIKTASSSGRPITPAIQHKSTFYGLAAASGDTTQSQSSNTVGQYTPEAKGAIQSMLGVSDLIATAENNLVASKAYAIGDVFTANGKLYKATATIAADAAIIPAVEDEEIVGANCEETSVGDGFVKFTDYPLGNQPGIVQVDGNLGIGLNYGKTLAINSAPSTHIKSATGTFRPIVPVTQHESTFYGLAKAAGDITQSSSDNAVGTYTDEAKAAIKSMIGVNVEDVQINGTSIVANGIANVPIATTSTFGAVKCGTGLSMMTGDNAGKINTNPASTSACKNGAEYYAPITPNHQHESTFYGLAKAAGDTTQSASSNAVGTYTDSAKTAIKNMLGITQTLTVTVLTQDNVTVTGQTVTIRAVDSTGPIFATAAYEGQPVAFAVPSGFAYHVSVSDTLAHHFNPTMASGIITNTDVSVTLQYSDFSTIRTAADIKAALNAGMDLTDLVGEQITCTKNGDTLAWDVVDYDSTAGNIMLLLHDAFGTANMVFEPAQALMWCENGLAAGSYTFADGSTHYYFTLTNAIPAGGQLRADPSSFWTYASQDATATLETGTVSTTEITGATDLGTCGQGLLNHFTRNRYGSNNQAESAIQWWLNSDAPANTLRTPVTKFSRAYSYNVPGFMNGLDQDFIDCLDDVDWLCSTNNVYECPEELGGYTKGIRQTYTIKSKFCFASEMEIFGSYGGTPDGSTVFDLYNGAEADDRKKYRGTSAQVWWLRSPHWSYASSERLVNSSGNADNNIAITSYAVMPACRISRDTEEEVEG